MEIFNEAYTDFMLSKQSKGLYKAKVEILNDMLKLKGDKKFQSDFLPTYYVGSNAKFVLFALNPGFIEEQNKQEEVWKSKSWSDYQLFANTFFARFQQARMKSMMYTKLSKLFAGIEGVTLENYDDIYDFYSNNLTTLQLFPYHSKSFALPSNLDDKIQTYICERVRNNLDFARSQESQLVVFNGKPFFNLFKDNLPSPHPINRKVNYYLFEMQGQKCLLFDKYVTQASFGVTNNDLELTVATNVKDFLKSA